MNLTPGVVVAVEIVLPSVSARQYELNSPSCGDG